jgi:hypothetical protein
MLVFPSTSQEDMEVVWHYHEVVQLELAGQGVRPKHVNKKLGFVLRPKKRLVHVGLAAREKRALARDDIAPVGFSGELYHLFKACAASCFALAIGSRDPALPIASP